MYVSYSRSSDGIDATTMMIPIKSSLETWEKIMKKEVGNELSLLLYPIERIDVRPFIVRIESLDSIISKSAYST